MKQWSIKFVQTILKELFFALFWIGTAIFHYFTVDYFLTQEEVEGGKEQFMKVYIEKNEGAFVGIVPMDVK